MREPSHWTLERADSPARREKVRAELWFRSAWSVVVAASRVAVLLAPLDANSTVKVVDRCLENSVVLRLLVCSAVLTGKQQQQQYVIQRHISIRRDRGWKSVIIVISSSAAKRCFWVRFVSGVPLGEKSPECDTLGAFFARCCKQPHPPVNGPTSHQ